MPLYSFVGFFPFGVHSRVKGSKSYHATIFFFNLNEGNLTPAACRMENTVSTTVLDIKCLTSVLQMKASDLESHFFEDLVTLSLFSRVYM